MKVFDFIGNLSFITGISLGLATMLEKINNPAISILTTVSLCLGVVYWIVKIRGKHTENKINKLKLREMQEREDREKR